MSKNISKTINSNNKTKTLCLYFELHQPFRLNLPQNIDELETKLQNQIDIQNTQNIDKNDNSKINFADFTLGPSGTNTEFLYGNKIIFDKICTVSYLPGLTFWLQMLEKLPNLKLTLGLSGTFLAQLETSKFGQEIIQIIKKMLKTGKMELLAETYYHSISSLFTDSNPSVLEKKEFVRQIKLHTLTLQRIFDYTPTSFRNTELIFNPQIGQIIKELNYRVQVISKPKITKNNQKAVNLAILKDKFDQKKDKNNQETPKNQTKNELKLALANFEATMFFFFVHRNDEFKAFFRNYPDSLEVLGTDFEIFGEHNGNSIFDLWENLLLEIDNSWNFVTVSELTTFGQIDSSTSERTVEINLETQKTQENLQNIGQNEKDNSKIPKNLTKINNSEPKKLPIYQEIFSSSTTSWTNSTQNLVSWLGNSNQDQCFVKLQEIYNKVQNLEKTGKLNTINIKIGLKNEELKTQIWDFFGKLSTSDNFYYMSDLPGDDGKLHAIFNAYPNPIIAFETFWRILNFFEKYLQTLE